MKLEDKIKFWEKQAREDLKFAENLFNSKKFLWCLFIIHLSIEKAIKARVLETTKKEPPHIHDLTFLARLAKIKLDESQLKDLETIFRFHIETRYEDYRQNLRKKAKKDYTEKYLNLSKKYLKWFLKKN